MKWWERFPGRLEAEIEALEKAGAVVKGDDDAIRHDLVVLDVDYPLDGERLALRVVYPDFYPYFRPEIIARELTLARHQHPFLSNLCLLGRRTQYWRSGQLVAELLAEQLPLVLRAARNPEQAPAIEENQADPVTAFYTPFAGSAVMIDSAWQLPPEIRSGTFTLRGSLEGPAQRWRLKGVVTEILGQGRRLAQWQGQVPPGLGHNLKGRWIRLDEPIRTDDSQVFLKELIRRDRRLAQLEFNKPDKHTLIDLIGVVFPEEVRYRQYGDGWIFVPRIKEAKADRPLGHVFYPALRAGPSDLAQRVPALGGLKSRTVAVFGLGAIGGPVSLDLARNGVKELRLVDHDVVEPGPSIRWPLGFSAYGDPKPVALQDFLALHYPLTKVVPRSWRLGGGLGERIDGKRGKTELTMLDEALHGVDLIFDATAEFGVHHLLSSVARERGIPYVYAFATPGAWGGLVARFRAQTGPCWDCLQAALYQDKTIPEPPEDPGGSIQPPGCADVTFTGAGFDLGEVALEATRTIVGMLGHEQAHYPDAAWDVAVLALRDHKGQRIPPSWSTHSVLIQESCSWCKPTAGSNAQAA